MLNLWNLASRADLLDRRELLRVGGLSLAGLSLPALFQNTATATNRRRGGQSFGQAKSCIILYLSGGPAQLDTFDPKPDAPDTVRGEFGVRQTRLPGVLFGEHIPLLAERNDRFSIIRTCA